MLIKHRSNYAAHRRANYPSVEVQLDALWHSMDRGEIPKAEPFYTMLADVKNKYPKNPGLT